MYIWLPAILLVYLIIMALSFKDELLSKHSYFQFYGTIGIELIVIILLFFFLRRRQQLRNERIEREKNIMEKTHEKN